MAVNEDLIRLIVAQIEDTPQHWSQKNWVKHNCNTTLCFAGWACFMEDLIDGSGKPTKKGIKAAISDDVFKQVLWDPCDYTASDRREFVLRNYVDGQGNTYYQWFPYRELARDALGLSDYQAHRLFAAYAASAGYDEYGREIESIDIFKKLITQQTGIRF